MNDHDQIIDRILEYTDRTYPNLGMRDRWLEFARDCEALAALWQQLADNVREEMT